MTNKKTMSRRDFVRLVAISGASLVIPTGSRVVAQSSDPVVEELARSYFDVTSGEKIANWWKTYQTLDYKQVESFNELASRRLSAIVTSLGGRGDVAASAFRSIRDEVNRQSLASHKLPSNQIRLSELNTILTGFSGSTVGRDIRMQAGAAASCACFNYPNTTVPGGSNSTPNGMSYIAAAQTGSGCGDCDWEVTYPAYRRTMKWVSVGGMGHYNQKGGRFIFRLTPSSKVIFGYWTTLFWQGLPSLLLAAFRLDP